MFIAKQTHAGQYKPYGDTFYEWDIETDLPEKEATEKCFEELLNGKKVPHSLDWHANIRIGGKKDGDYGYYFAGYYTMKKTSTGYHFTKVSPFTD